jgi:hypothetical protein
MKVHDRYGVGLVGEPTDVPNYGESYCVRVTSPTSAHKGCYLTPKQAIDFAVELLAWAEAQESGDRLEDGPDPPSRLDTFIAANRIAEQTHEKRHGHIDERITALSHSVLCLAGRVKALEEK